MTKVLISRSQSTAGSAGTTYYNPTTLKSVALEVNAQSPWPVACNITSIRINIAVSQGAASRVFTLRKTGSDTAHTLTFTGGTLTGTITTSVAWAEGDLISIKEVITGSPAALGATGLEVILEYEPTTAAQAGYTWGTHTANVGASMRNPLFSPVDVFAAVTEASVQNVVAVDGDITKWWVLIPADSADGAGTITAYIWRNGVRQDGTGGSVDSSIVFNNSTTWANPQSRTATIAKNRGDTFSVEIVHAGATTFAAAVAVGIQCTNDVAVESDLFLWNDLNVPNSATSYSIAYQDWQGTESAVTIAVGPSSFGLSKPYAKLLDAAPGSGNDYTFTLRKNAADVSGGPVVTIAGTTTPAVGEDSSDAAGVYDAGDSVAIKSVPTSTPTSSTVAIAYVMTGMAALIKGSFHLGANGTINSSHTVLVNVDGVTRAVNAPGSLYLGGYFVLHEKASAPSAIANTAILYAIDNGAGKTKLMVQFPTGSPIQIEIEA